MKKRFAGILLLMLVLVACGSIELPDATETMALATSIPTQTQASTVIPTEKVVQATSTSSAISISLMSQLQFTHDLMWFEAGGKMDGHLMRWNASNNEIEILAGEDIESLIGSPGKIIGFDLKLKIVLVTLKIENEENPYYELGTINLDTEEYLPLIATSSSEVEIVDIALSSNGRWAAYILGELDEDQPDNGRTHYSHQELLVLRISNNPIPVLFGACEPDTLLSCISSLSWSQDNSILAWRGPGGMWMTRLGEDSELVLLDHYGRDETDDLRYFPSSWSPNSRYLIVRVGGWESTRFLMYDIVQERYTRIPYIGYSPGGPQWSTDWLPNGQLLIVVTAREVYYEEDPRLVPTTFYRFSMDDDLDEGWFYQANAFELDSEFHDEVLTGLQMDWNTIEFIQARTLEEGTQLESVQLHLFSYDLRNNEIFQLNQMVVDIPENYYGLDAFFRRSPDEQSVLFGLSDYLLYMTADGFYAAAIQDLFGSDACCFAWVNN